MHAKKSGGLGWACALASLGVLTRCQLLSGIDPDDLPAQDAMGAAGASSEGGRAGAAGHGGDQGGGGQGGVSGQGGGRQGGGGQGGGEQGGSAGGRPEPTLLASGDNHTCARGQGVARCWGANNYGQLGTTDNNGADAANPVPALVDSGVLTAVHQMELGGSHSCALRDDGRVLCWGYNEFGQLGSSATSSPAPMPRLVNDAALGVVKQLALGYEHSCALRDDGRVLCWGLNSSGQLGTSANSSPNPVPALVDDAALGVVKQLALGYEHSCALRDDGRVLCWGLNKFGQLGRSATISPAPVPVLIENAALGVVKQLALGVHHSCALRDDGRVLCWGINNYGQLGTGTNVGTETATPVPALVENTALGIVRHLALGSAHNCALRDDGRVLCWGYNFFGQLGDGTNNGTTNPYPVPALVEDAALGVVKQLALGRYHSCALRDDGSVLCWGHNKFGQLGRGTNNYTDNSNPVPALVAGLPPLVP